LGYLEAKAKADPCGMTTRKAKATAKAEVAGEGRGREADFSAAPLTMKL
jgi:hypothetical protein